MQEGLSYIKDSNNFMLKIKDVKDISKDELLFTADVVDLYPNIPYEAGLRTLTEVLVPRNNKKTSTNDLVKIEEFVLKNNYLEFNGQVKQQISGTTIGTKFTPKYAIIFMDEI